MTYVRKFFEYNKKPVELVTIKDVREFLGKCPSPHIYHHYVKSLRRFFRDYLKRPDVIESFKLPQLEFKPRTIPSKDELFKFYNALTILKDKALLLVFASSGLRRSEVLTLHREDIDFDKRMIRPRKHSTRTKKAWISFFNEECEKVLKEYLASRKDNNTKLFPMSEESRKRIFDEARQITHHDITPQVLREWFCSELARLGVPDRYVDAFCGRIPRSVLARHYTDFSPERLKEIYDKANIQIFMQPHNWKRTNYGGVEHEYIMVKDDPELAERIKNSPTKEVYKNQHVPIILKDGYKYWLTYPCINRRIIQPSTP